MTEDEDVQLILAGITDRKQALDLLGSKNEQERKAAALALEKMGPEAADELLERLKAEAHRRRKRQRVVTWIVGSYLAIVVLAFAGWAVTGLVGGHVGHFPFGFFNVFSYTGAIASVTAASRFQKNAATILAKFDDVRAVGPLADALEYGDKEVRAVATDALAGLLPRLHATDAHLLDDTQRKCLHRAMLSATASETFVLGAIKGLRQVGDERDMPTLRRIADGPPSEPGDILGEAVGAPPRRSTLRLNQRVRDAARESIPIVDARVEAQRASQTLLRAAEPLPEADTLVRPAGMAPAETTTLVRPVASEGDRPILAASAAQATEQTIQEQR